ncbi:uncharacterized protein RJT20DRAFT_42307 [Scheffersomyces xylosifermentans]|uniref:uncharacterized protein n=1 Tax=Scheffersomyces xylosifermentans TaxID=1304137 RepID=UPI00315D69F6
MPDFVKQNEASAVNDPKVPTHSRFARNTPPVEEVADGERKSLHQQLQENRDRKQREFQEQMEAQNSSYKLDEKSAQFYEQLKRAQDDKERNERVEESEELKRYRAKKKASKEVPETVSGTAIPETSIATKARIRKRRFTSPSHDEIRHSKSARVSITKEDDQPVLEGVTSHMHNLNPNPLAISTNLLGDYSSEEE